MSHCSRQMSVVPVSRPNSGGSCPLLLQPLPPGLFQWQPYLPPGLALKNLCLLSATCIYRFYMFFTICRLRLKRDGTRAETRFRLSAKRTSPFKSAGTSVQSTTGSRGVRISGSNAGYTKFRRRVKGTGYPLYTPVSPSLPFPCVTVCHHVSTGFYHLANHFKSSAFCPKILFISLIRFLK